MEPVKIGIIGGSGLYQMPGLSDIEERTIETPFGSPSDAIVIGTLSGVRVAFLARHGRGHRHMPSELNYRANIFALKTLGVERVISVSACGSLREDYAPGHIVVPDQLFDYTKGKRPATFFGNGIVVHISIAEPFCQDLSADLLAAVRRTGATVHAGGKFITIEGPRFSTKAESHLFRQWGMDIIGMTACPEAFLAREAEMCYATMAHVTDYDVWHEAEEPVTVEMIIRVLNQNTAIAQQALAELVKDLAEKPRTCTCGSALANAIVTAPEMVPNTIRRSLAPLIGRYLPYSP
ncbi:MAG: S-methyl-5'-thioadenosine phosphorylase [Chloroflexota bacterium]